MEQRSAVTGKALSMTPGAIRRRAARARLAEERAGLGQSSSTTAVVDTDAVRRERRAAYMRQRRENESSLQACRRRETDATRHRQSRAISLNNILSSSISVVSQTSEAIRKRDHREREKLDPEKWTKRKLQAKLYSRWRRQTVTPLEKRMNAKMSIRRLKQAGMTEGELAMERLKRKLHREKSIQEGLVKRTPKAQLDKRQVPEPGTRELTDKDQDLPHSNSQSQVRASRSGRKFLCEYCLVFFKSLHIRDIHIKRVHEFPGGTQFSKFSCELCSEILNSRSDFVTHMKNHQERQEVELDDKEPLSFYQCDYTGCYQLQFRVKTQFQEHLTTHLEPTATKPFECETCSKLFAMEENYEIHLERAHGKESNGFLLVGCNFCWGIFGEPALWEHSSKHSFTMEEIQNIASGFLCEDCGKLMSTQELLQLHTRKVHKTSLSTPSKRRLHECGVCGKGHGSWQNLHHHYLRYHTYEHGTMCYICDKRFKMLHPLNTHIRTHTKTPTVTNRHNCTYCTKVFGGHISRNKHHFLAHHDQYLARRPFHCIVCFVTFETEEENQIHYDGHLRFKCHICSLHNMCKRSYDEHMKTHAQGSKRVGKSMETRLAKIEKRLKEVGDPIVQTAGETSTFTQAEEAIRRMRLGKDNYVLNVSRNGMTTQEVSTELDPAIDLLERSTLEKEVPTPSAESSPNEILTQQDGPALKPRSSLFFHRPRTGRISILPPQLPFKCPECLDQFQTKEEILPHLRERHNVEPTRADQPVDMDTYRNPDYVEEPSAPRYKCDDCDKTFYTSTEVIEHRKSDHGIDALAEEYPFACDVCSQRFLAQWRLDRCMKSHAEPKRSSIRKTVSKDVSIRPGPDPDTLHKDQPINTQRGDNAPGMTSTTLVFKVVPAVEFNCDLCPRKFISQTYLELHKRMKHSFEPNNHVVLTTTDYPCDLCPFRFITRERWRIHKNLIHNQEPSVEPPATATDEEANPISTIPQGQATPASSDLTTGELPVLQEKSFPCHVCSETFKNRFILRCHKWDKHKINTFGKGNPPPKYLYQSPPTSSALPKVNKQSQKPSVQCKNCALTFENPFSLNCHMWAAHKINEFKQYTPKTRPVKLVDFQKVHKCTKCPESFHHSASLQSHLRWSHRESEVSPGVSASETTLPPSPDLPNLDNHENETEELSEVEPTQESGSSATRFLFTYKCPKCPEHFLDQRPLLNHLNLRHGEEDQSPVPRLADPLSSVVPKVEDEEEFPTVDFHGDDDDWEPEDPLEDPLAGTLADLPPIPYHSHLNSTPFLIREIDILPQVTSQQIPSNNDGNLESGSISLVLVKEEEDEEAEVKIEESCGLNHLKRPHRFVEEETEPYSFYNSKYTTLVKVRERFSKNGTRGLGDEAKRLTKALPFAFVGVNKLKSPPNKRSRIKVRKARETAENQLRCQEETTPEVHPFAQPPQPEDQNSSDSNDAHCEEIENAHLEDEMEIEVCQDLEMTEKRISSDEHQVEIDGIHGIHENDDGNEETETTGITSTPDEPIGEFTTRIGRVTRSSNRIPRIEAVSKEKIRPRRDDESENSDKSEDSDWSPPVDELPKIKSRKRKNAAVEPQKLGKVKRSRRTKPVLGEEKNAELEPEKSKSQKVKKVKGKGSSQIEPPVEETPELEPGEVVQVHAPAVPANDSFQDSASGSDPDDASDCSSDDCFSDSGTEKSSRKKNSKKKLEAVEKSFLCSFCPEQFKLRSSRRDHEFRHHPDKCRLACSICHKELPTYAALIRHRRGEHKKDPQYCKFCDKRFPPSVNLQAHIESTHKGNRKPYKCEDCGHCFQAPKKMQMHRESIHGIFKNGTSVRKKFTIDISAKYPCEFCSLVLNGRKRYNRHLRAHVFNEDELRENPFWTYLCDFQDCNSMIRRKDRFITHLESHGDAFGISTCTLCDKVFTRKENLEKHAEVVHGSLEKVWDCPYCIETFKDEGKFREHEELHKVDLTLSLMGNVICDACGKSFVDIRSMNSHISLVHGSEYPLDPSRKPPKRTSSRKTSCPICKEEFGVQSPIGFEAHVDAHIYEHGLYCFLCEKRFSTYQTLVKHLNRDHNSEETNVGAEVRIPEVKFRQWNHWRSKVKAPCKYCGLVIRWDIYKHYYEVHHDDYVREVPFMCDLCYAPADSSQALDIHRSTHDKYKCQICGKQFLRPAYFKTHILSHADPAERPFGCSMCDKRFTSVFILRDHESRHRKNFTVFCPTCPNNSVGFYRKCHLDQHLKNVHGDGTGEPQRRRRGRKPGSGKVSSGPVKRRGKPLEDESETPSSSSSEEEVAEQSVHSSVKPNPIQYEAAAAHHMTFQAPNEPSHEQLKLLHQGLPVGEEEFLQGLVHFRQWELRD